MVRWSFCSSYRQAQWAASVGLRKLEELGIPTQRPDDYFAEMVKTDDHMRKVICAFAHVIPVCSEPLGMCCVGEGEFAEPPERFGTEGEGKKTQRTEEVW